MESSFKDPERRRRAIRAVIWFAPVLFAYRYGYVYLTEAQPTPRLALVSGSLAAGLCLLFAASLAVYGRQWMLALRIVSLGLCALLLLYGFDPSA